MIRIIYGIPGAGKTALMVALGIEHMYGENAMYALDDAQAEVNELNEKGFNVSSPKSEHLVYGSNVVIDVISPDFGHRRSLALNADRIGIATDDFIPQYVYRSSTLLFDELPDDADSREWNSFPANKRRYWAKHRKHSLNIFATCQIPIQADNRIRALAVITHVCDIEFVYNEYDEVTKTIWTLDNWDCYEYWEQGREPTREIYEYNGDIRRAYNTYDGEEDFYIGLQGRDFSCEYAGYTDYTPQGIEEYAKKHPIKKAK